MKKTVFLIITGWIIGGFMTANGGEIKIITPGQEQNYKAGETLGIKWTASAEVLPYVKIELIDSRGNLVRKISGGVPKDKDFSWNIPVDIKEGGYRVKIVTNDSRYESISEVFHISKKSGFPKSEKTTDRKAEIDSTGHLKADEPPKPEALPRPETPKPKLTPSTPLSVHQGVLVTPVVKFQDIKLEEIIRKEIKRPAPGTIFSSDFRKLKTFTANGAGIKKINGLEYMDSLEVLDLSNNEIFDLSSLVHLKKIRRLNLSNNQINDISALVDNINISEGTVVELKGNPFDCKLQADNIARLKERGVKLDTDCP